MSIKRVFFSAFTGLFFLGIGTASAQFSRPISIGAGGGASMGVMDLPSEGPKFLFYGEVDFQITPFISIGAHGEKGRFSGVADANSFENNYYAGNFNLKVRLGQFLGKASNFALSSLQGSTLSTIFDNIYIGAGGGLIKNRTRRYVKGTYAEKLKSNGGELSRNLGEIGLIIPLNVGVDIPLGTSFYGPRWAVNLNYQHTFPLSDNLDGILIGENDQYRVISVGIKYAL
ncbi:hypothetical protein [Sphingobacterium kitahiroshimense]|uniref:Outer membrane protein beta-barrel domain-containing protein n=1 Tax=Sphingobacterium kitahiroshimense TaxID=470446 RepID=A0ABV0BW00_9SPHI